MVKLKPGSGVERRGDDLLATSEEPWLDVEDLDIDLLGGLYVEITYRLSLLDDPCRPIFRFWLANGTYTECVAVGPICGAGMWIGKVPLGTFRLSVSPTNQVGPFRFAIESVRRRSWVALLNLGARRTKRSARSAVLTKLIGWHPESDNNLSWAIGSIPFGCWQKWRAEHHRGIDGEGFDRPRFDWRATAPITIIIDGLPADAEAILTTIASLQAQTFPNWTALVVAPASWALPSDPRISRCQARDHLSADFGRREGLTTRITAGDSFYPYSLAYLVEQAHRSPKGRLFYGDEVRDGQPVFKPGWSQRLAVAHDYFGGAIFLRNKCLLDENTRSQFVSTGRLPASFVASLSADEVKPLRRILLNSPQNKEASMSPAAPPREQRRQGTAAIIVPTKNHAALLERLLASIRARTARGSYQIAIADNGSTDPRTVELLAELRSACDVVVLDMPGLFNFSRICNQGAAATTGEVLVFLNDDMEILSDDWLVRLVDHALDDEIGAVGAKLTYPDGLVQHVGVLVGMGGSAGHFGALLGSDDPGWANRNRYVHEVSAVTGACLAVSRRKFEAVGGFDAEHLPIELSDIDLCLKLNAKGWQTIVDPDIRLMHEESASRGGATFRRLDVYGDQRSVFTERWRHVLRDDPLFHPGLSLYSPVPALG